MPGSVRATVVVDLGFGDAGKGLLTDHLVRSTGARLVVRYNGGAQAGHNVVTPDGRHHTFSQLGAGSFVDGVETFLASRVVIHPTALLVEAESLAGQGVPAPLSRLAVSRRARVVTPFHQALGRLRELARGADRHGSCGVGIGETVGHGLIRPGEMVVAGDLAAGRRLADKLERIRAWALRELAALAPALQVEPEVAAEREILETAAVGRRWMASAEELARRVEIVPTATLAGRLRAAGSVVFEGAQGVLLDGWHGFHPHTTWSDCTMAGALALLAEAAPGAEVRRLGVLRSHAVRHGAGPLPTEDGEVGRAVFEHNRTGPWQGPVRHGWFDAVLGRYALEVVGRLDGLALTHLDLLPRLDAWRVAIGYQVPASGVTRRLVPSTGRDLAHQERLTRLLDTVTPVYREVEPSDEAVLAAVEELLGLRVALVSRGPSAGDVEERLAPGEPRA